MENHKNSDVFSNEDSYYDESSPTVTKKVPPKAAEAMKEDIPANPLLPKLMYADWR